MKLIEDYTIKELHDAVLTIKHNRKQQPSYNNIEEYLRLTGGIELLVSRVVESLTTGELP